MANTAEALVVAALNPLFSNVDGTYRLYPDAAPNLAARPYGVFQAVGGKSANYLNNTTAAQENARIQVAIWADDRLTAKTVMASVVAALSAPPINATSIGAPVSVYEYDTRAFGSRLDFSIWFTP